MRKQTGRIAWAILLSNRQRERARQLRRLALLEKPTRSQKLALDTLVAQAERAEKAAASPSDGGDRGPKSNSGIKRSGLPHDVGGKNG